MATEITAQELNTELFTNEKVGEIRETVEDGMVINALSGGVDSSVVTMLGHRALGNVSEPSLSKTASCARERPGRLWIFSGNSALRSR